MNDDDKSPAIAGGVLIATESFSTTVNGTPRAVTKGETFREGHPVTVGREGVFKPFVVDNELETATAAPGETKEVGRQDPDPKTETSTSPSGDGDGDEVAGESSQEKVSYAAMKRPALLQLLTDRGIEHPNGVGVKNAALAELLEQDDAAKGTPEGGSGAAEQS